MKPERIKRWFGIDQLKDGSAKLPEEERSVVGVVFEDTTNPYEQIGELKGTPAIDQLKGKLHWIPVPQKKKTWIALIIGTTAAVGTAYIGYRHFQERSKRKNPN
ncbi:hypothetical protein HYS95_01635 [Candidatus Daviesbacteria bacterium]|nr:hypothetical protein [Candidatus Daviesbacteria bacterium]